MNVNLTAKNYRCFPDDNPLRIQIRDGFTAFVGVNNSGKSSMLRFFYEFRVLFDTLANENNLLRLLRGDSSPSTFGPAQSVKDLRELFSDSNGRDMTITFAFPDAVASGQQLQLSAITVTVPRNTNTIRLIDFAAAGSTYKTAPYPWSNSQLRLLQIPNVNKVVDFKEFVEVTRLFIRTIYIGAFRNAINAGSDDNYFDIPIGQSFIKQWSQAKSGNIKQRNELVHKITRDIRSIFGFEELQINPTPDSDTLQFIVNENSFKLNELALA